MASFTASPSHPSSSNKPSGSRTMNSKTNPDPKSSSFPTSTSTNRPRTYSSSSSSSSTYLLFYNSVSALAWTTIFSLTVRYIFSFLLRQQRSRYPSPPFLIIDDDAGEGRDLSNFMDIDDVLQSENDDGFIAASNLYDAAGTLTRWTQTAAVLEIGHAISGLVRASPLTTAIQVSSRLLLVWAIIYPFPTLAHTTAYPSMLLAWSITEVIRYTYFAVLLNRTRILDKNSSNGGSSVAGSSASEKNPAININDQPPSWLTWSRYNLFFVLYPLGILSEMRLVYLAIEPASQRFGDGYDFYYHSHDDNDKSKSENKGMVSWLLWTILAVYVPGSYIMITHMMAQRRRVKRGKAKSRTV